MHPPKAPRATTSQASINSTTPSRATCTSSPSASRPTPSDTTTWPASSNVSGGTSKATSRPRLCGTSDSEKAHYSPLHADRYREPLRIVAQELFRVQEGFPRIIRSTFPQGIPAGVDDIGYTINLAACADFRIATGPHDAAVNDIRGTLP